MDESDVISPGVPLSGSYTMTLGEENMSNATNFVVLVRIALAAGESVTSLSIGGSIMVNTITKVDFLWKKLGYG